VLAFAPCNVQALRVCAAPTTACRLNTMVQDFAGVIGAFPVDSWFQGVAAGIGIIVAFCCLTCLCRRWYVLDKQPRMHAPGTCFAYTVRLNASLCDFVALHWPDLIDRMTDGSIKKALVGWLIDLLSIQTSAVCWGCLHLLVLPRCHH
jgi:hypothetical protein